MHHIVGRKQGIASQTIMVADMLCMRVDYGSLFVLVQVLTLLHFNPHHVTEILSLPRWEAIILGLLTETSVSTTSPPPFETVPGEASLSTYSRCISTVGLGASEGCSCSVKLVNGFVDQKHNC